jgi:hypothetical protein
MSTLTVYSFLFLPEQALLLGAVSSAKNSGSGKGRWSWRRCGYEEEEAIQVRVTQQLDTVRLACCDARKAKGRGHRGISVVALSSLSSHQRRTDARILLEIVATGPALSYSSGKNSRPSFHPSIRTIEPGERRL